MRQKCDRIHYLLAAPSETAYRMNLKSVSSDVPLQKNQPCNDLLPLKTIAANGANFAKCQITAACWSRSPRSASIIKKRRGPVLLREWHDSRLLFVSPI